MVEGDVGIFAVFGAQTRKVCPFGKYWLRVLYFVNEDIAWRIVGWKSCPDFLAECDGITAEKKVIRFKIYFNDMVGGDAAVEQMLLENGEKEKTFSATAHPNENLYQVVAFCLNKAIEQQFALNYHCRAFRFVCMLTDLKVVELYQNLRLGSTAGFRMHDMSTNLKALRGGRIYARREAAARSRAKPVRV
jgi:hypothetical protein